MVSYTNQISARKLLIPINLGLLNWPYKKQYFYRTLFHGARMQKLAAWVQKMRSPQPYLTVASILAGFSISVFMFRIQRELRVREMHPDWPNWLAWADYLVIATIVLSVSLVVVPLVAFPEPTEFVFSIAAGTCAATSLLLLAYPFAILDHYGIEIGGWRRTAGDNVEIRHKGEPVERVIVILASLLAIVVFAATALLWNY